MVRNPTQLVDTANGQPLGSPTEMLALPRPAGVSARLPQRPWRRRGGPAWARRRAVSLRRPLLAA
eukprot:9572200-Alexandrium_andersonii.AAC.1